MKQKLPFCKLTTDFDDCDKNSAASSITNL